jgi:hypothetical protein
MTDRDITGEIRRAGLNRLPALLGIDGDSLKEIAERVRQFDQDRSDETRQRKALEKLTILVGKSTLIETPSESRNRESQREREVLALEVMAVAQAYQHEELRDMPLVQSYMKRLNYSSPPVPHRAYSGAPANKTREEEGETRD